MVTKSLTAPLINSAVDYYRPIMRKCKNRSKLYEIHIFLDFASLILVRLSRQHTDLDSLICHFTILALFFFWTDSNEFACPSCPLWHGLLLAKRQVYGRYNGHSFCVTDNLRSSVRPATPKPMLYVSLF